MMNKKIIVTILIVAAAIIGYLIWSNQTETPQTVEEITAEIERLQNLIKQIKEDNAKVEQGKIACIQIYDPVCGADGRTYSNDCFAAAAGVKVAHQGECK